VRWVSFCYSWNGLGLVPIPLFQVHFLSVCFLLSMVYTSPPLWLLRWRSGQSKVKNYSFLSSPPLGCSQCLMTIYHFAPSCRCPVAGRLCVVPILLRTGFDVVPGVSFRAGVWTADDVFVPGCFVPVCLKTGFEVIPGVSSEPGFELPMTCSSRVVLYQSC
jgi:hypothetical protein